MTPKAQTSKQKTHHNGPDRRNHLAALGQLVEQVFPDPTHLFEQGLALLVHQLRVDRAVMTRLTHLGYEALWWASSQNSNGDPILHESAENYCPLVLEHPNRTLVVKDTLTDPVFREHPATKKLGIRAYIGVPLRQSHKAIGVLSVHGAHPIVFSRAQIAMVNAVAELFSKTLEIESLKAELYMTRDALDLTTAVVEDSALESSTTRLPNRNYLDIWLKANLFLARRRVETMAVVRWHQHLTRELKNSLREIADSLRGEDLLVDLGKDEFLLLLPRTGQDGAEILLDRIRTRIGHTYMGATLWNPMHKADRDDFSIKNAFHRATLALEETRLRTQDGASTWWDILPLNPEDMADITRPW